MGQWNRTAIAFDRPAIRLRVYGSGGMVAADARHLERVPYATGEHRCQRRSVLVSDFSGDVGNNTAVAVSDGCYAIVVGGQHR